MVANSFNKIVEESNKKVPRNTKRTSDKAYNARRRAKRKLERELKKENPNQNIVSSLQEVISSSYFNTKKKKYEYDVNKFYQESFYYKQSWERKGTESVERKNELFKREINQASSGGVSSLTKEETKIFYAATQKIWQGKPQGKWNEAIMDYFGVATLEEAWDKVFENERVQQALKEARANQQPISTESDIAIGSSDEREEIGSPDFIKGLILDMDTNSF